MRRVLSLLLSAMLVSPQVLPKTVDAAVVKDRVLKISAGSPVEIQLFAKGKLRGRIGAADDNGFSVQVMKNGKIESTQVSYSEVKSLKNLSEKSFGKRVGNGLIVTGIVLGTIGVLTAVICATSGCNN